MLQTTCLCWLQTTCVCYKQYAYAGYKQHVYATNNMPMLASNNMPMLLLLLGRQANLKLAFVSPLFCSRALRYSAPKWLSFLISHEEYYTCCLRSLFVLFILSESSLRTLHAAVDSVQYCPCPSQVSLLHRSQVSPAPSLLHPLHHLSPLYRLTHIPCTVSLPCTVFLTSPAPSLSHPLHRLSPAPSLSHPLHKSQVSPAPSLSPAPAPAPALSLYPLHRLSHLVQI
jgi:hypothetical protein